MAFDPGFPNADEDAHLVENKARIKPDYSILSTDSFPALAASDAGRIIEYTDTGDRFRWTGALIVPTHIAGNLIISDGGNSITVDDGALSLTVDTDDGSLSTYHKPDYSILSTDTKPTPAADNEGVTLEYTDTGTRYRWTGTTWINTHLKGALNIHDADVHNIIIDRYLHEHTATQTTLTVATVGDGTEYTITVASATGFVIGDYIHINTTSFETTHPVITGIAGNVFTLDRRLDVAHSIGDTITKAVIDMSSQAGTMAAPIIYEAWPEPGVTWHLTRILFEMTHGTAGDLGLFGNLASLGNGVVLRARINGQHGTLTNWKANSEIKTDMFDVVFDTRSGGGGTFGTSGRGTFTEAGAVLKLDGDNDDRFQVLIQDDITALSSFSMKCQGHIEGG